MSYKSRIGKIVKERVMGPPCSNRCKLLCSTKFNNNFRAELIEQYWKLGTLQRQRDFLGSCIEPLQLKYRRIFLSKTEPRRHYFYWMTESAFMYVNPLWFPLGITERTIRTIIQSKATGTGIVDEDRRGRHGKHKKTKSEILDSVRAHKFHSKDRKPLFQGQPYTRIYKW